MINALKEYDSIKEKLEESSKSNEDLLVQLEKLQLEKHQLKKETMNTLKLDDEPEILQRRLKKR